MTCSYETERIAEDRDRLAHNPEVASTEYACLWTEESRERRSTACWRVDVRLRPHGRLVLPCTGHVRKSSHAGRKGGVVSTWPVVTVTDQGDAIRVPVQVNVFQHGVAKMGESRCV